MESLGVMLFRLGLLALPRWLRQRAGQEMLAVFVARHRAARGTGRWKAWAVEFGGLIKTAAAARMGSRPPSRRTILRSSFMDILLQDFRFGVRSLIRRPTTAVLAVVTLGLGIAASTAMFSVVDAVLLKPLPFPEPQALVSIYPTNPSMEGHPTLGDAAVRGTFSWPEFAELRDHEGDALEGVAILSWGSAILTPEDGPAERVTLAATSPSLFGEVLRVSPLRGRVFGAEDEGVGDRVLLTETFWERRFGRDPGIVGSTVDLGGMKEVVGILPATFALAGWEGVEVWTLMGPEENRGNHSYYAIGRLAPGVSPERAASMLTTAFQGAAPPGETHDHAINVFSRHADETRAVRGPLTLLAVAAGVLLLVACGSVAVLLLGAAIDREQELAVRGALGAGRRRLARQLFTESLVLAGAGALVGLLLTVLATDALVLLAPAGLPRVAEAGVNGRALAFGVTLALACGVLFGMAPALLSSQRDPGASMSGTRGNTRAGRARLQGALVVGELALATVLLVGAGLLGRTVLALNRVDAGFAVDELVSVRLAIPFQRVIEGIEDEEAAYAVVDELYESIGERVKAVPGVRDAAYTSTMALTGDRSNNDVTPEGYEGDPIIAERRFVSGNFFDVMGIRLVEGRGFTTADDHPDAPATMVISEGVARAAWPGESPLGRTVSYWGREATVVGVAAAVRDEGLGSGTEFAFYVPRRQAGQPFGSLVVRTQGDPAEVVPRLRDAVWSVDRNIAVPSVRPFRDHFAAETAAQRYRARLVVAFSSLAVLFALMGVYGITSRSVAARTRELGIRMALGAERGTVMGLVLRQALRMAVYGGLAGLAAAWLATRLIERYLWGVEPTDLVTLVGTAGLLATASLLAALAPGRRAARVDPMEALRAD